MNLRINKNVSEDLAKIKASYKKPASRLIVDALLDLAERDERDEHPRSLHQTARLKGSIGGVKYNGKPLQLTPKSAEQVFYRLPLDDDDITLVKKFLNKSIVPLSLPDAIRYLSLYYMGVTDEKTTVYNLG